MIHLGPDTQLQVGIERPPSAVEGLTVEQKLEADARRAADGIQARSLV